MSGIKIKFHPIPSALLGAACLASIVMQTSPYNQRTQGITNYYVDGVGIGRKCTVTPNSEICLYETGGELNFKFKNGDSLKLGPQLYAIVRDEKGIVEYARLPLSEKNGPENTRMRTLAFYSLFSSSDQYIEKPKPLTPDIASRVETIQRKLDGN